ncbi:gfo/Idh/MocA family oxidoreductase [candidate division KSB1 bacterium]|nr:Gfo/Idh/MocA family oxidoreductase [candidate division KSB1 bacterium]RQV99796.1 MAG: gfo/Idh/MocA family oxidoreductase [candidate division KSB1 bacterium]
MSKQHINRRDFLKGAVSAGAAFTILPSGFLSGQNAPSNKLNIALIGADGRARAHYNGLKNDNVVALCDVDEKHLAFAAREFPDATHYVDWRKCLEQKDLDAVVCCTPDHTHAFIAVWAMNRGLHLYLEKPMGISVEEVRLVREAYMKNKDKLAVQHGTQRHAKPNFDRVRELIQDGAVGTLSQAHAWGNRQLRRPGYPKGEGQPPKSLHYDLWLGPAPFHPYTPEYFSGGPGMNCLQWNMYWDFGTGQVGDMGSHTMDLVWNAIDAGIPTSAAAEGEKYHPEVTPVELTMTFEVPANAWRPAIDVAWHQGGAMPISPRDYVDLNKIGHGVMFKGDKGFLVASFDNRIIIPHGDDADMTYYNRRSEDNIIEPMGDFQQEWLDACKGDLKTSCDLEYAGSKMEMMMLGLVAYRAGKKLEYDGVNGQVTNDAKANQFLKHTYRDGWVING